MEPCIVNSRQPTAELRPAEEDPTDETDLMYHTFHHAVERLAIRAM